MRIPISISGMKERSKLLEIGISKELTNRLSAREATELLNGLLPLQKSYSKMKTQQEPEMLITA